MTHCPMADFDKHNFPKASRPTHSYGYDRLWMVRVSRSSHSSSMCCWVMARQHAGVQGHPCGSTGTGGHTRERDSGGTTLGGWRVFILR